MKDDYDVTIPELDHAIEMHRLATLRIHFDEYGDTYFEPPFEPEEQLEVLKGIEYLGMVAHFPALTYDSPEARNDKNWRRAMRKLRRYMNSKLIRAYRRALAGAALLPVREETKPKQEASEEIHECRAGQCQAAGV